jgi:hypothetical protein
MHFSDSHLGRNREGGRQIFPRVSSVDARKNLRETKKRNHVEWVSGPHGMAGPLVADGEGILICRVAADILKSRQGMILHLGGWAGV